MANDKKDYRRRVLTFLEAYVDAYGFPPTYQEIQDSVGLSSRSHVHYYLAALEEEGRLQRTPHMPRGLRLVPPDSPRRHVAIDAGERDG